MRYNKFLTNFVYTITLSAFVVRYFLGCASATKSKPELSEVDLNIVSNYISQIEGEKRVGGHYNLSYNYQSKMYEFKGSFYAQAGGFPTISLGDTITPPALREGHITEFIPITHYRGKKLKNITNYYSHMELGTSIKTSSLKGEKQYTISKKPHIYILGKEAIEMRFPPYSSVTGAQRVPVRVTYYEPIPSAGIVTKDYTFYYSGKKYIIPGLYVFIDDKGTLERLADPTIQVEW